MWVHLGAFWGYLGRFWGHLGPRGCILGPFGAMWVHLGAFWGYLGLFGAVLGPHILSSMQYTAEGSDLLGAFTRATFCTVVSSSPIGAAPQLCPTAPHSTAP